MSKILAVFGATGQQGGSVVDNVLNDPELSQQFKIRAITRDVTSPKAQQLKERVEVVTGDLTDISSLKHALADVHTVFVVTTPSFTADGFDIEYNSVKAVADVAVEQGVKYIIFSTLPGVKKLSGGKYSGATHFDAKAEAEQYIRTLPIQSAFVSLGGYMENYSSLGPMVPQKQPDDTYVLSLPISPNTKLPMLAAVEDTGKFVGTILAEPDKYEGKVLAVSTAPYTMEEVANALSKSSGKTVVYKQAGLQQFTENLPPFMKEAFPAVFGYVEEFGYYGSNTDEQVALAAGNARGKLLLLDDYFKVHPFQLQ